MIKGIYIGDTGPYDGLTKGVEYELDYENERQYLIKENDLGGESRISKDKFDIEPLLSKALEAVGEEK